MAGVLGPGEAGLSHGESRLHEHDQKSANKRPDHVDRDPVLAHHVRHLGGQRL